MSFIKIQKIDPNTISNPDYGHVYLGQDNTGLWQKDENGSINYILSGNTYITINSITGTTYIVTGSTSSGTSGISSNGTSGTSGKSGVSGTFGTSGSSGNGTSGTSGYNGSSGTASTSGTSGSSGFGTSGSSATSGYSGSSGVDGNGSSGTSGINGGYGGASRKWVFTINTTPTQNNFNAYSTTFSNYDLVLLDYIRINQRDFDNQDLDGWLDSWNYGIVKIEDELNLQNYGLYKITNVTKISLDVYELSGFTILSGNGTLVPDKKYLISYISIGVSGTSGSSGFGTSGSSGFGTSGSSGFGTSGSSGASPIILRIPINDSDYVVTGTTDQIISYTNITAKRIINLPPSTTFGQIIEINDENGNVNSTNRLKIIANGSDTIAGDSYNIQITKFNSVQYKSDGLGHWTIYNRNQRISAGMSITPTYIDTGTGVTIGNDGLYNLYKSSDGSGLIRTFEISGGTFALTDLTTNYVVADYNSGTPYIHVITNVNLINETTVIPMLTIYRGGTRLHILPWTNTGLAMLNKLHQSIVKTQRYRLQSGLSLGEIATRVVSLTEGVVWVGANSFTLPAFNSTGNTLFLLSHNSGGTWDTPTIVTQYNNTQYDDGSGLHTLTSGRYAVNYIYRGVEVENECYMVLGQGDYKLLDAQGSLPPPNLPPIITSHAILVGRIIVEKSLNTAFQIDSIFSAAFALSTSVNHNDLSGLDGGVFNEYFHLTETQWGNLTGITSGKYKEQSYDLLSFSKSGTSITTNLVENTMDFETTADIYQYLSKNIQIDHDKELISGIKLNIHWFQTENNNPNFLIQYKHQRNNNSKETAWNYLKCNNLLYSYVTGTTINQISYSTLNFTGTTLSDILQIRIIRDKYNNSSLFTGNDLYSTATSMLTFGVIYTIDSFGSNNEFIK